MTRCDDIHGRLSEFVDGDLTPALRGEVQAHVDGCAACRGMADDLTRLRAAAGALAPIAPPDHIWLQVAGQIHLDAPRAREASAAARRGARRQWLALAAALVVVTLGISFVARMRAPAGEAPGNLVSGPSVEGVNEELNLALDHYENAIAQLKTLAVNGDDALDPDVAAALDRNIAVIDAAIAESRAALNEEPASQSARASLFEALSQKVNVLQATVTLMNDMRRGDPEAAAQTAAGIGKKS
jgi:anti-sigma factor RsiW